MSTTKLKNERTRFRINPDSYARRRSLRYFFAAGVLLLGVYFSELFRLLKKPLFSKVYYGNLNTTFFALSAAAYIFLFILVLHRQIKKRLHVSPFQKHPEPLSLSRKGILYLLTVLPILLTAAMLNFRFKLIYELGERITGMSLLGNAVSYFLAAAKLFSAVYLIFLIEHGCDILFSSRPPVPLGGAAALLTFGVLELVFTGSAFGVLYALLFLYDGILYLISGRRFGITFALALILYIL
ncbi:MAG: hypothetical protein ACI3V2_04970 [Faecousia sp.]